MHIDIGIYMNFLIIILMMFFILRTLKVSGANGIIRNNVVKNGGENS